MPRITTKTGHFGFANYQLKRTILEKVLGNLYATEDRDAALKHFGGCAYCGSTNATRNDHLIPVFDFGDFVPGNVVPACPTCDDSKGRREYSDWMRNATGKKSLSTRGISPEQREARIGKIHAFVLSHNYHPRTEEEIFGDRLGEYYEIIKNMDDLVNVAKALVEKIDDPQTFKATSNTMSHNMNGSSSTADLIRHLLKSIYFDGARAEGKGVVEVRAGDLLGQLPDELRRFPQAQYSNVCQAMRGKKLQSLTSSRIIDEAGPRVGANTVITYSLH